MTRVQIVGVMVIASMLTVSVGAQPVTVAVFAASATNPNTALPVAVPVTYTPTCQQTPKVIEVPPIVNPTVGAFDDPANPTTHDCRLNLAPQVAALVVGSGYKAAVRLAGAPYGVFSTAFAVQPPPHPCDTTPTSRTTALVGQSVTVGYCHPQLGTGGDTVTVTSFRLYRNGVLLTVTPTISAPSVTGWVFASVTRVEGIAGVSTYDMSAVTALGEGARSAALGVTVTQPATLPVAPSRGRIQ